MAKVKKLHRVSLCPETLHFQYNYYNYDVTRLQVCDVYLLQRMYVCMGEGRMCLFQCCDVHKSKRYYSRLPLAAKCK